jgi:hypothetical protein
MRKPQRTGLLRHKITIVDKSTSVASDGTGSQQIDQGVIAKDVWCDVKYIGTPSAGASEDNVDYQRTGKMKIEARMRYREDITHEDLVFFMGAKFEIYSIQERGRDELLVIRAEMRDDDTFSIAVGDQYTDDFYKNNIIGYEVDDQLSNSVRMTRNALIPYGSDTSKLILYNEYLEGFSSNDVGLLFELPADWFNDRSKSGLMLDPSTKSAEMAFSNDGTIDVSYTEGGTYGLEYETTGVINEDDPFNRCVILPKRPNNVISHYLDIDINKGFRTQYPAPFSEVEDSRLPRVSAFQQAFSSNYDVQTLNVFYKESYGSFGDSGKSFYTPGLVFRYHLSDGANKSMNPSYFGNSIGEIKLGFGIKKTQNGPYQQESFYQDVSVEREGAIPFVDLCWANIIRYGAKTVDVYGSVLEDFTPDFENPTGTTTCPISESDYWDVSLGEGSSPGTKKLEIRLRYNKIGSFVPHSIPNLSGEILAYPINIHHASSVFLSGGDVSQYVSHYFEDVSLGLAPDGVGRRPAIDTIFYATDLGLHPQLPNVAIEDLAIRVKNVRLVVNKLDLPDDFDPEVDPLTYTTVEYPLSAYEQEAIPDYYQLDYANAVHRAQCYVFDNIPYSFRGDDFNAYQVAFDVEYDFNKHVDEDQLCLIASNEDSIISIVSEDYLELDEQAQQYMQSTSADITIRAANKREIFPYTAGFLIHRSLS